MFALASTMGACGTQSAQTAKPANPENRAAGVYFSDSKVFLLTCVLNDDGTFALTWYQVNFLRKANIKPQRFWEGGHYVVDGSAITLSMEYSWNESGERVPEQPALKKTGRLVGDSLYLPAFGATLKRLQ
jgi:hypothetical protein